MESLGIINYLSYVLGVILVILLPGPNSLYVLAVSIEHGEKSGWKGALGVLTGDTVLILLASAGAASLLEANPRLFDGVKYMGAFYLAYLGIKLLINGVNIVKEKYAQPLLNDEQVVKNISRHKPYKRALMISLINPKAILFFLSFFVQFVDPTYDNVIIPLILLGLTLQFCSLIYLSTLIYLGIKITKKLKEYRKLAALSSGATGLLFIGFSLKLAMASL